MTIASRTESMVEPICRSHTLHLEASIWLYTSKHNYLCMLVSPDPYCTVKGVANTICQSSMHQYSRMWVINKTKQIH